MNDLLRGLAPVIAEEVAEKLEALSADEKWKQEVIDVASEMVREHGSDGIQRAIDILEGVQEGKSENLRKLSLRSASEVLAMIQRGESKKSVKYLKEILDTALPIIFKLVLAP